jgi:predicted nucleotidyltransferase component of viral defense system
VARSLRERVQAPVLGGIAVYLHGYPRATEDLDLYTPDRALTASQLEAAGAKWDIARREHILDAVPIHTVTPEDAKHVVEKTSKIDGVRVVSLKDLIAIKMLCGLENVRRTKDMADVVELICRVPLDKRFAAKLPTNLRAVFKKLVDGVRADESRRRGRPRF